MKKSNTLNSLLRKDGFLTLLASLLCILGGLLVGYIVLLIIEPSGAWKAIVSVMKNYMVYPNEKLQMKYLGQTLVRTAPLLMCALSVLFAYKVGMFNIGVAGQYVAGACAALPVHHQLPEFTQTHIHRVSDAIQPSHLLLSPSPAPKSLPASESFPMSQLLA